MVCLQLRGGSATSVLCVLSQICSRREMCLLSLAVAAATSSGTHNPRLAYILRGVLFNERMIPISKSGMREPYKQDIRFTWPAHQRLIATLSELYTVNIFFSTYKDTHADIRVWAQRHGTLILSQRAMSTQFTTALKALDTIKDYDYYFITRSDIKEFHEAFHTCIKMYPQTATIVARETNTTQTPGKPIKLNDIVHFLPSSRYESFRTVVRRIVEDKSVDAHNLYNLSYDFLTSQNFSVRTCNSYYTLLGHMHGNCHNSRSRKKKLKKNKN